MNYDGELSRQRGGEPLRDQAKPAPAQPFLIYGTGIRNHLNPFPCNAECVLIYGKPPFSPSLPSPKPSVRPATLRHPKFTPYIPPLACAAAPRPAPANPLKIRRGPSAPRPAACYGNVKMSP